MKIIKDIRAEKGPSPAQRMRRVELLAEKESSLKQFTTLNAKILVSKKVADSAIAQYEEDQEEKRVLEATYRDILAKLGRIPAELSSFRKGMFWG